MKIKNIFNSEKGTLSKKFFSTKTSKDLLIETNEGYLIAGKLLFGAGNYKGASEEFNCVKNINELPKEDLDKIVSTFIKVDNTDYLSKILIKLPEDYTVFAQKYSLLNLATIYHTGKVIVLLAQKGMLAKQLTMKDGMGRNPFEVAILNYNIDFFNLVKTHLPKNLDKNILPSYKNAKILLDKIYGSDSLKIAVESLYNHIENREEQKEVEDNNNSSGGTTEAVSLAGINIASADIDDGE